jgi:hypothetical protein
VWPRVAAHTPRHAQQPGLLPSAQRQQRACQDSTHATAHPLHTCFSTGGATTAGADSRRLAQPIPISISIPLQQGAQDAQVFAQQLTAHSQPRPTRKPTRPGSGPLIPTSARTLCLQPDRGLRARPGTHSCTKDMQTQLFRALDSPCCHVRRGCNALLGEGQPQWQVVRAVHVLCMRPHDTPHGYVAARHNARSRHRHVLYARAATCRGSSRQLAAVRKPLRPMHG